MSHLLITVPGPQAKTLRAWLRKEVFLPSPTEIEQDAKREFSRLFIAVEILEKIGWSDPVRLNDEHISSDHCTRAIEIFSDQRHRLESAALRLPPSRRDRIAIKLDALVTVIEDMRAQRAECIDRGDTSSL